MSPPRGHVRMGSRVAIGLFGQEHNLGVQGGVFKYYKTQIRVDNYPSFVSVLVIFHRVYKEVLHRRANLTSPE